MSLEAGPPLQIARVREVGAGGCHLVIEYPNGNTATVTTNAPLGFAPGDVLRISADGQQIELAPDDLWREVTWVGVVRVKLDDVTVVDKGGNPHLIDTNEVDYRVGNTVEASEADGVLRVLQEKPLKYVDLAGIDDDVVESFKQPVDPEAHTFDDFGGLPEVVKRAQELIELPLEHHKKLAKIGARPIKGVLFTGQPGTGKTMLARIIASQAGATFYEISGPEIFSKWYGESEELLRRIFEDAAEEERSIIFFDEIDSVAGHRDEDSHEASRRVVAQLLALMDGFTPDDNVVVVATTNRPEDIDRALRRPGRFDWEIHFRLPDEVDRLEILRASARHLETHGVMPHEQVAAMTDGWSAAELAAIWSEAALLAVADKRDSIMAEDYLGGQARVAAQRERISSEAWQGAVE